LSMDDATGGKLIEPKQTKKKTKLNVPKPDAKAKFEAKFDDLT
jgi:hypothetical protein